MNKLIALLTMASTKVEKFGKMFCYFLTWLFLLILNPGHSFDEIKKQEMNHDQNDENNSDILQKDTEFLYLSSHSYLNEELERIRTIDEKNKVLLTIAGLLLATMAALSTNISLKWIIIVPMIPILSAIYLILIHFSVKSFPIPNWESVKKQTDSESAKKKLAEDIFSCGKKLGPQNDFRVGVYRAAARAILLGVGLLFLLLFFMITNPPKTESNGPNWLIEKNIYQIPKNTSNEKSDKSNISTDTNKESQLIKSKEIPCCNKQYNSTKE